MTTYRHSCISVIAGLWAIAPLANATEFPVYDMTVALSADQSAIAIAGEISIPASDGAREEIVLGLSEALGELEAEIVEPEAARGAQLVQGELHSGHADGWGTHSYVLRPAQPVPAGQSVKLSFRCGGAEATAFVYHLGAPVSFAAGHNSAWYPQVEDPRVDESGWTGLRSSGVITFEVPDELAVYAMGRAEPPLSDARRFTFDTPVFFSFSAGPYRVIEATDSPTAAYFLRERDNEHDYVEGCAAVLKVLEASFGGYPHSRFAVVEVPTADGQAAGFAGASLDGFIMATSSFLDRRFNTAYFGHEIGHQWWGNLMTTSGDRGGMMFSEGMAQFGSLVAVEAIDGADAAERYRRTGYPGYIAAQSGLGYLSVAAAGFDDKIPDANQGPAARIIADGKGFQVWNMLADHVGRERFFDALQTLVVRHTLEPVHWDDFLADLAQTVGEDLDWFYDQWFERTGAPYPSLEWSHEAEHLELIITQPAPAYRLTLEVEIESADGCRELRRVDVAGTTTTIDLIVPDAVRSVVLDPRYRTLRWTPEYRAEAEALAPAVRARLTRWSGKNDEAEALLRSALTEDNVGAEVDIYGRRFAIEAALGSILAGGDRQEEARAHLEAALRAPSKRVDDLPWVYFHLGKVALRLEDDELLQEARRSIRSADVMAGGTGAPEALQELVASR